MSDSTNMTKTELIAKIKDGWNRFTDYLATLTPAQLTTPADAAGWTAKDHINHLAHWEASMLAMLNKQDRAAAMGIDAALWNKAMSDGDFDPINGIMQKRDQDKPLAAVQDYSKQSHQRLMDKVNSLTDEDLQRPYDYFQPDSGHDVIVIDWLYGNTYEHYDEHQSYIAALIEEKNDE